MRHITHIRLVHGFMSNFWKFFIELTYVENLLCVSSGWYRLVWRRSWHSRIRSLERRFGWASRRSVYFLSCLEASPLRFGIFRSRRIMSLGINHGAPSINLRIWDWNLSRLSRLELRDDPRFISLTSILGWSPLCKEAGCFPGRVCWFLNMHYKDLVVGLVFPLYSDMRRGSIFHVNLLARIIPLYFASFVLGGVSAATCTWDICQGAKQIWRVTIFGHVYSCTPSCSPVQGEIQWCLS